MLVPEDTPHIAAACANCGFIFDLKFGTDCPACHHIGVAWAHLLTEQEAKERGAYAQQQLRAGLDAWGLTEGDNKAIAELDRMYALEDKRL